MYGSKTIFGQKNFMVKKIFGQKIFGLKNFWVKKLKVKKNSGQKDFGPTPKGENICLVVSCPKRFFVEKKTLIGLTLVGEGLMTPPPENSRVKIVLGCF